MKMLWENLKAGVRLLLFRRFAPARFHPSGDQWVLLAILQAAWLFCADLLRALPDAEANIFAFADYSLLLVTLMLAGYLLGRLWRDRALIVAVPVMVISVVLPFSVAVELAQWLWPEALAESTWPLWLLLAWVTLAVLRGFYVLSDRRLSRAAVGVAVTALVGVWPLLMVGLGEFWQARPPLAFEEDLLGTPDIDGEEVMYQQPALLAQQLAPLQSQRPGVADLYFVGFAGDASQDVFAEEATYARTLMDQRYDSRGRSLLLINNPATATELPIASNTNLKLALQRVGALMNPDEDVLMLFLTSHGSQDFELAVNFPPIALNPLTPEQLKHYLDEAGIQWRIVIVSACYSGGYVARLRDARTVVMTAAAPDRTSFGCDTDRDFTYFGEAYFRDELAHGTSLLDAFHAAAQHIAQREQREGLTPSQPQLYVGDEIATRLSTWEAGWRKAAMQ